MKFSEHQYKWTKRFSIRHEWSVVGPSAAVSFWASVNAEYDDTAGLEIHYFNPPSYMGDRAPSHLNCPFTGGRCWHDGTSLYAMETLWPRIKIMLEAGDHESVFGILELDLENRINKILEEQA